MGSLFKSSKQKTTQTSSVSLPDWMSGAMHNNSVRADELSKQPFEAWTGPSTTNLTDDQRNAMGITAGVAGYVPQQVGVNGQPIMVQAGSAVQQAGGLGNLGIAGADLSGYQDPYTQQVIDASYADIDRSTAQAQQQASGKATLAGAFGGDRAAIEQAEIAGQGIRTKATVGSNLRSQGFQRAQDLAEQDITRGLGALQQDNSLDLQGQLANQGAIANFQNLDLNAQQSNQSAGIAGQQLALSAGNQLFQQGEVDRQAQEAGRQFDYGEFLRKINDPYNKVQWSQGITTGAAPYFATQTTTGTTPGPSAFGQIAGGVTAGIGALGLAGLSDRRDKTDIEKLGPDPTTGIDLYAYRYKGDPKTYPKVVGPMAQDIERANPGAVREVGGHKVIQGGIVDYAGGGEVEDDAEPWGFDPNEPPMLTRDLRHLSPEAIAAVRAIYPAEQPAQPASAPPPGSPFWQSSPRPLSGQFRPNRGPAATLAPPPGLPGPASAAESGGGAGFGGINAFMPDGSFGGAEGEATAGAGGDPPPGAGIDAAAFRQGEQQGIAEGEAAQARVDGRSPSVAAKLAALQQSRDQGIAAPAQTPAMAPSPPGAAAQSEPFEDRLGRRESGDRWASVNRGGYSGRYQFGADRLAELGLIRRPDGSEGNNWDAATFAIPGFENVRTHRDFLRNPEAQRAAFASHLRDIDQAIEATPGAREMDRDGLRAVAHLGGVTGMRQFVSSGGRHNPADANGTRLSDYYRQFSGGEASLPATARRAGGGDAMAGGEESDGAEAVTDTPPAGITMATDSRRDEASLGFFGRLSRRLADPDNQGALALMQAGAAMMASRSPHAAGAIGEGIAAGTQYAQRSADLAERRAERREIHEERQQRSKESQAYYRRRDEDGRRRDEAAQRREERLDAQRPQWEDATRTIGGREVAGQVNRANGEFRPFSAAARDAGVPRPMTEAQAASLRARANSAAQAEAEKLYEPGEARDAWVRDRAGRLYQDYVREDGGAAAAAALGAGGGTPSGPQSTAEPSRRVPDMPTSALEHLNKNVTALDDIDQVINRFARSGGEGTGFVWGNLPDTLAQRLNPSGVITRADIARISAMKIHDLTGAAQTVGEVARLRPFLPSTSDNPEVIAEKLKNLRAAYGQEIRSRIDTYGRYRVPEAVERRLGASVASQGQEAHGGGGNAGNASAPVRARTAAEAEALPPGTLYTTPDGRTMRR